MASTLTTFDRLTEAAGCDQDAKSWIKVATDPFHDFDVNIAGIPDNDSQDSVVQIFNEITTITAPVGLGAGQLWSCHITTLPLAKTVPVSGYFQDPTDGVLRIHDGAGVAGDSLGTVTYVVQGTGYTPAAPALPTDYDDSFPRLLSSAQADQWSVQQPTRHIRGISYEGGNTGNDSSLKKIIAGGFEVHNDTSSLYKQGSVTVYSSPMQAKPEAGKVSPSTGSASAYLLNTHKSRQPPASIKQAAQLPNSRTWEAADGCYVPIRLGDHTNYDMALRSSFRTSWEDVDQDGNQECGLLQSDPTNPYASGYAYKHRSAEIECTGAYFTGLSQETVLTLRTKFIIEVAPTAANQAMLSMATPTPAYCPRALEIYHRIIRKLPPGVPVHFNDKGDWFRMITSVLRDAAPVIAPYLASRPALAAGVAATGTLAGLLNTASNNKKNANAKKALPTIKVTGKNVSTPNRRT